MIIALVYDHVAIAWQVTPHHYTSLASCLANCTGQIRDGARVVKL